MKDKTSRPKGAARHAPLGEQILTAEAPKQHNREKSKHKEQSESEQSYVNPKLSQSILRQAREQQEEVEGQLSASASSASAASARTRHTPQLFNKQRLGKAAAADSDSNDEDDGGDGMDAGDEDAANDDQDKFYGELQIDPKDEETLKQFMAPQPAKRVTLGDIIMGRIKEKETEIASQMSETLPMPPLDPKVLRVYKSVGQILSKYRSGKVPKAFKIIPSLRNWEEILYITDPDGWSAAAMYQATRIFVSNLNVKMAQRFFNLILLPRVRDDIAEYKRLNFHLYMAIKKAMFKSAAFFKGILIPLLEAGDCTLQEAVIVGSAVSRTSVPLLQSAAALLKVAEMPYTGACSIILRVLLDKKYALPYRVIDALVFHFHRFTNDTRELPVLWHQALLVFVQRYKEDISTEQKEALLELLRAHPHPSISPEVRREIVYSRSRDNEQAMETEEMEA